MNFALQRWCSRFMFVSSFFLQTNTFLNSLTGFRHIGFIKLAFSQRSKRSKARLKWTDLTPCAGRTKRSFAGKLLYVFYTQGILTSSQTDGAACSKELAVEYAKSSRFVSNLCHRLSSYLSVFLLKMTDRLADNVKRRLKKARCACPLWWKHQTVCCRTRCFGKRTPRSNYRW